MDNEKEKRLSEIICKLSSMTFVLHGCCLYYEGVELDSAKLVDYTKILHEITNDLFDLM